MRGLKTNPILRGKDARRFMEAIEHPQKMDEETRLRIQENYNKFYLATVSYKDPILDLLEGKTNGEKLESLKKLIANQK